MNSRAKNTGEYEPSGVDDSLLETYNNKMSTLSLSSEVATALLDLKKSDLTIGPLSIPSKQCYNSKTGLVHGLLRVQKKRKGLTRTVSLERFEFLLEGQNDNGTDLPLLVAFHPSSSSSSSSSEKKKKKTLSPVDWMMKKRHFAIAQYSNHDKILGEIAVSPYPNKNVITFSVSLFQQVDCCFIYKVHSLDKVMAKDGTAPPREVECVRFTDRAKTVAMTERGGGEEDLTKLENTKFYRDLLKEFCPILQQPPRTLQVHCDGKQSGNKSAEMVCDSNNYLNIFYTAQPILKAGHKVPSLNMKGRGAVTSNKNMQLINGDGVVCLQVAKCDSDTYHVDFCAPFNPFQAFAFAIAQIVL